MGRGSRHNKRRDGGRRDRDASDSRGSSRPYTKYPDIVKENTRMNTYYDATLALEDEEKDQFWTALRRELPNSFRFCGSKGHALAVKRLLQTRYIPEITKINNFDGQPVDPPQVVPWYPDNLAWSMTTPKNVIRKFPPFAAFQRFLVSETSVGNISRQEVVSMIPPLLMDLHPGMTVLDMCAAPGSKAAQLLEMIHRGEEARIRSVIRSFSTDGTEAFSMTHKDDPEDYASKLEADPTDDGRATGMLVANDSDFKRSHMLIHQLKRLSSPNLMVTNHDATLYPAIRVPHPSEPHNQAYLKFDRILADVPCSGDGTLRKNVGIWKDWTPGNAIGLHTTQTRILVRALSMLQPGGRVVYSTCSMNPLENEAVIAAAINRCGGSEKIEIVDCSEELPGLKRKPGLKNWQVMDRSGRIWNSWQEVQDYVKDDEKREIPSKLSETLFSPLEGSDAAALPLERCMRVYAHMQDTGAFFITALHKKAEFKARPEDPKSYIKIGANGVKDEATKISVESETGTAPSAVKNVEDDGDNDIEDTEAINGQHDIPEESKNDGKMSVVADDAEHAWAAEDEKNPGKGQKPEPAAEEATPQDNKRSQSEEFEDGEPAKRQRVERAADEVTPQETDGAIKQNIPAEKAQTTASQPQAPAATEVREPRRKLHGGYEEPFKYLKTDHKVIKQVSEFYKISSRFPSDRFLVRNAVGEPAKAIYYTSKLVRDILVVNEGRGVKFVHAGVKMFVKQDSPSADVCSWRIQSEGMPILHGYVGADRIVVLRKKETLRCLLIEMFPMIANGRWESLDEIGERVRDMSLGCCVLRVEPDGEDEDFAEEMALPLWKSFQSLNLMLPKEDRSAMLLRIYNDHTPLVNMGLKGRGKGGEKMDGKEGKEDGIKKNEETEDGVKKKDGTGKEKAEASGDVGEDTGIAAIMVKELMDVVEVGDALV